MFTVANLYKRGKRPKRPKRLGKVATSQAQNEGILMANDKKIHKVEMIVDKLAKSG